MYELALLDCSASCNNGHFVLLHLLTPFTLFIHSSPLHSKLSLSLYFDVSSGSELVIYKCRIYYTKTIACSEFANLDNPVSHLFIK